MLNVFDSSAVLEFFYNEPGAGSVRPVLADGVIGAVNAAEVLAALGPGPACAYPACGSS
jgi:PIN domain nuclease of toxin-antitoxin system